MFGLAQMIGKLDILVISASLNVRVFIHVLAWPCYLGPQ
jgi:hypothetical protein